MPLHFYDVIADELLRKYVRIYIQYMRLCEIKKIFYPSSDSEFVHMIYLSYRAAVDIWSNQFIEAQ